MMIKVSQENLPTKIRYPIIVGAIFVFWVMIDSIFSPIKNHMWADPELLNATGAYTIPACYFVIVYFVVRHYDRKQKREGSLLGKNGDGVGITST